MTRPSERIYEMGGNVIGCMLHVLMEGVVSKGCDQVPRDQKAAECENAKQPV